MSTKYADLIDQETVEEEDPEVLAEAEETETPVEETPSEGEPEPVGEKQLKALGKVFDTYTNGLKRVMGDDFAALHECPSCSDQVPGFLFTLPEPLDDFKWAPDKIGCPECDGYGQVRSGAKNANALVMCMKCTGNGYVGRQSDPQPSYGNPSYGASSVPPGYLPASSNDMPMRDQWGRPLGHQHFGMDPASIGA